MITAINKTSDGFRISTDKGERFLDYIEMNEIIGYIGNRVVGYGDGHRLIRDIETGEYELLTPFDVEYKKYELEICPGIICWYQCTSEDEEVEYQPVFNYLEKIASVCCWHIHDVTKFLISELVDKWGSDTVSEELANFLTVEYALPDEYEGNIQKYDSRHGYILQLAKLLVEAETE